MKNNTVLEASGITVAGQIDIETIVQDVEKNIGTDSSFDELNGLNSKSPNDQVCGIGLVKGL